MSESEFYQVHTANEDGWNDYHEEDDETDDFEVAVAWLRRHDVQWGEIRYNGQLVAWTEENPNYAECGGSPNVVRFEDGWNSHGRIQ